MRLYEECLIGANLTKSITAGSLHFILFVEIRIQCGYNLTKHWNILRIFGRHVNVSEKMSMFS